MFYTCQQWNKELCLLDSDGDGKTNGAELGDPHCTWSHNAISFDNISNPGTRIYNMYIHEQFEDTKGVIRSGKSRKDIHLYLLVVSE